MATSSRYPSLESRVVIVTGGGRGLGRSFSRLFADQGAVAVVADRNLAGAEGVREEIAAAGGRALAIETDVSDAASVQAMVDRTMAELGRIDVVINNAGLIQGITLAPFWELPIDEWRRLIDVNLTGAFLVARAAVPHMIARQWGRIINISSSTVATGRGNYLHYTSSKSAMIGMTRSMAREVGPHGITAHVILPGATKIEVERLSARGDHFEKIMQEQSVKRTADPSDHANLALWLCSDDAGYMSGHSFITDGGRAFI